MFRATQNMQMTNNTTWVHELQETNSNGGNQPGKNGIPTDWVRIELCTTDEISEFQLNNETARTHHGMRSREIGAWEERAQFAATKPDLEQRVWDWMGTIDAWYRSA